MLTTLRLPAGELASMQLEQQYGVALSTLKESLRSIVLRYLGLIRFWLPNCRRNFAPAPN